VLENVGFDIDLMGEHIHREVGNHASCPYFAHMREILLNEIHISRLPLLPITEDLDHGPDFLQYCLIGRLHAISINPQLDAGNLPLLPPAHHINTIPVVVKAGH
jgi:hypothetical protein